MSKDRFQGEPTGNEYWFLGKASQREVIKRRTVDFVRKAKDFDTLIFLDKGARPISQLFRDVWPAIYPDQKRPQIKFVNIGSEKTSFLRYRWFSHLAEDISIKTLLSTLISRGVLERTYGKENVDKLVGHLASKKREQRLIVDEVSDSGTTGQIARKIIHLADNKNSYESFVLIESDQDKEPFRQSSFYDTPFSPWHSARRKLVRDDVKKSFFVVPSKPQNKNALQVRTELKMLAGEIVKEIS